MQVMTKTLVIEIQYYAEQLAVQQSDYQTNKKHLGTKVMV